MKPFKQLTAGLLSLIFLSGPFVGLAAEAKKEKLKPYPLKTCIISGEKLGEMGKPYVYAYKGQEIKFCCKNCLKDFQKDPAKYLKKIDEAAAKAKKADPTAKE